jgi:hypothetical protein
MLVCEVEIRKRHFDSLTSVYPARDELGTWNPILVAIFLATQSLKTPHYYYTVLYYFEFFSLLGFKNTNTHIPDIIGYNGVQFWIDEYLA